MLLLTILTFLFTTGRLRDYTIIMCAYCHIFTPLAQRPKLLLGLRYKKIPIIIFFFFFFSVHLRNALRTPGCQTPGSNSAHPTAGERVLTPPSTRATDGTRASTNSKKLCFNHGHLKCETLYYETLQ